MPNYQVIGTEELLAKFKALSEAVQGDALAEATMSGGQIILEAAKGNIQEQGLIRTRTLSRSLSEEVVEKSPQRAVVAVGTNLEYAAIHEFGGVIQAKRRKYLAIPVGELTGSPMKYDLHAIKTRKGNLVLMDASGKVQYVLKPSVRIPARPYLRPAFDEKHGQAQEKIGESLKIMIEKAAAG